MMRKILVVEDSNAEIFAITLVLNANGFDVTISKTKEGALARHMSSPHYLAILFDGWLNENKPDVNTCDLIREIKKTFKGPMIAMSNDDDVRKEQMAAGCTHDAGEKRLAANLAVQILKQKANATAL